MPKWVGKATVTVTYETGEIEVEADTEDEAAALIEHEAQDGAIDINECDVQGAHCTEVDQVDDEGEESDDDEEDADEDADEE